MMIQYPILIIFSVQFLGKGSFTYYVMVARYTEYWHPGNTGPETPLFFL